MPYAALEDLPHRICRVLPIHAQEIYRASFNSAYQEYQDKSKRQDSNTPLETLCHKVAWAAVKNKYCKAPDGQWVEKLPQE